VLEKQEILPIRSLIPNGFISFSEGHVPYLAFACIKINAVFIPSILISILLSTFSGECENGVKSVGMGVIDAPFLMHRPDADFVFSGLVQASL